MYRCSYAYLCNSTPSNRKLNLEQGEDNSVPVGFLLLASNSNECVVEPWPPICTGSMCQVALTAEQITPQLTSSRMSWSAIWAQRGPRRHVFYMLTRQLCFWGELAVGWGTLVLLPMVSPSPSATQSLLSWKKRVLLGRQEALKTFGSKMHNDTLSYLLYSVGCSK